MSGWPDGSGRDPVGMELPSLPPKWSQAMMYHSTPQFDPDYRHIQTTEDTDQAVQKAMQAECDHLVKTTAIHGGEPLSVTRCMSCGAVDWADLREQADAYARRYATQLLERVYGSFVQNGRVQISWDYGRPKMAPIQQIHDLFSRGEERIFPIPGPANRAMAVTCTDPNCNCQSARR